jgi:hypothetical protein
VGIYFSLPNFKLGGVFMAKKSKVKIKMLVSMVGNEFNYIPQEIVEVEQYIADSWVEGRIAELVKEGEK